MLIIIEKVLILRSVNIFSALPDESLAYIAPFLSEIDIKNGDTIIRKGQMGSSLFIIVRGLAYVESNGKIIAKLTDRDVFGELAALDPEERTADVIAKTDCLLLQLEHRALEEILDQHSEVSRGIIAFLCQRLRHTLQILY
jgi:CRP/FNR family cyclic AMP-dependent transcriptional regulator